MLLGQPGRQLGRHRYPQGLSHRKPLSSSNPLLWGQAHIMGFFASAGSLLCASPDVALLPLDPARNQGVVPACVTADVCPHFHGRMLAEGHLCSSSFLWATSFNLPSDEAVVKLTDVPFTLHTHSPLGIFSTCQAETCGKPRHILERRQ